MNRYAFDRVAGDDDRDPALCAKQAVQEPLPQHYGPAADNAAGGPLGFMADADFEIVPHGLSCPFQRQGLFVPLLISHGKDQELPYHRKISRRFFRARANNRDTVDLLTPFFRAYSADDVPAKIAPRSSC